MKAQDFLVWMDAAGCKTALDVSRTLGLARETGRKIVESARAGKDLEIKHTVELAMSAVAMRLSPWSAYER